MYDRVEKFSKLHSSFYNYRTMCTLKCNFENCSPLSHARFFFSKDQGKSIIASRRVKLYIFIVKAFLISIYDVSNNET